ncbi:MAG: hypothetical protein Unbinned5179contig1000_14 [Prokaryotic dsDNA virus sp.]|nr:MAG: hypothetical protein Unbinned5179contig1000_14 [Prokaryotic dsDNA virus sp.]
MALTSQMAFHPGGQTTEDPQAKALKNERKRVTAYIRQYERNPDSFSSSMLSQLEQLAMQYQIPFKRKVPDAAWYKHVGAFQGGVLDSVAFDLIPDDWYSSEATRKAANYGKIGGAGAQIIGGILAAPVTGGSSLLATGKGLTAAGTALRGGVAAAQGMGKIGAAARGLGGVGAEGLASLARGVGSVAGKTPLGRMTTAGVEGITDTALPYMAGRGSSWAKGILGKRQTEVGKKLFSKAEENIKAGGSIEDIVSGQTLSSGQINNLAKQITTKYSKPKGGLTNTGKEMMRQLNTANQTGGTVIGSIKPNQYQLIVDKIFTGGRHGGANLTVDNVVKTANKAGVRITRADAEKLTTFLQGKGHTKMIDAAPDMLKLGAEGIVKGAQFPKMQLQDLDKWKGLTSAAALGFAGSQPFRSRIQSREELESGFTDPYDPYNQ